MYILEFLPKAAAVCTAGAFFFSCSTFSPHDEQKAVLRKTKNRSRQFSQIVLLQLIYSLLLSILFILFSRISQSHQRLLLLPELHCPRVLLLPHGFRSGFRSGCRRPRDRALYPHPEACRSDRLCRSLFRRRT